ASSSDLDYDVILSEISNKTDTKIFNKIDINGRRLAFNDFDCGTRY
ncbi:32313_t:CDS:1, partial [Gigaspora margarita]